MCQGSKEAPCYLIHALWKSLDNGGVGSVSRDRYDNQWIMNTKGSHDRVMIDTLNQTSVTSQSTI